MPDSGQSKPMPGWGLVSTCGAMASREIWLEFFSLAFFWARATTVSRAASRAARETPKQSQAPPLMRASSTRLVTLRRSTRQHMSKRETYSPSLRASMISVMALSPTFLMPPRPKTTLPSRAEKERWLALTEGCTTSMPMSLQQEMYLSSFSWLLISEVSRAAMNSTVWCTLR